MVSKEQRQRRLAREKFERQNQRRSQSTARRRRRNQVIASVAGVAIVAGGAAWAGVAMTGDDPKASDVAAMPSAQPSTPQTADPVNTKPATCAEPEPGEPSKEQFPAEPEMTIDEQASYTMTLKTTCGDVVIDLKAKEAPHTVNSFHFLAEKKFFDHSSCHRLTTGGLSVLQCGDPTATGSGGPGYKFADENLPQAGADGNASYPAGTVAMANSGPGTNGSQFFLVYQDSTLPPNYTPFGTISSGLDVVRKIADAGTEDLANDGRPHEKVVLNSVTVDKK